MTGVSPRSKLASAAWIAALVFWICFVWGHSLVPGPASDADSIGWAGRLSWLFSLTGVTSAAFMNVVVRKAAHFCEYLVLGVLDAGTFLPSAERGAGSFACTAIVAVLVPSVDETIQLFVAGRSGQVSDVVLDLCGACVGLIVAEAIAARRAERRGGVSGQ